MATESILQYCAPATSQKLAKPIKKKASGCLFGLPDNLSEQVEGTPEKNDKYQGSQYHGRVKCQQLSAYPIAIDEVNGLCVRSLSAFAI